MNPKPKTQILLLSGLIALLVLAACEPSTYGENPETQVARYLTQTVPTVQAGGNFPTLQPDAGQSPPPEGGGVAATPLPTQPPKAPTEEDALVTRVVDGDTIELEDGRNIRLIGINTPEIGQPFYAEASQFTTSLVQGKVVSLAYDVQRTDQYGRTLAYVYMGDLFVNLEIVKAGFANAYTVQPNSAYSQAFVDVERDARNASRGLWTPSVFPLNVTALNPAGEEWVEITNEGADIVDISGFTVKDEANHIFTFPQMILVSGASIRVYTGTGINTTETLYWNLDETVWNDDGDTAFLRDPNGAIVDTFGY